MKHLELFDQAGVDVRPQIREIRDEKKMYFLDGMGTHLLTLQEYAEHKICGKPFNEMSENEVREVGHMVQKGEGSKGYFLPIDSPIYELLIEIDVCIQDTVEMYHESNGYAVDRQTMVYRRRVEQAIKLGMNVPEKVRKQEMFR